MLNVCGKQSPRLAKASVCSIALELECEQFQREWGKRLVTGREFSAGNHPAQARGKFGKFCIQAVFVSRLVFRHSRSIMIADDRHAASGDSCSLHDSTTSPAIATDR